MKLRTAIASLAVLLGCGDPPGPTVPSGIPAGAWEGARLLADAGEVPLSSCGVRDPPCRMFGDDRYHPTLAVNARGQGLVLWQQEEEGFRQWWSPFSTEAGFGPPRPTGQAAGSFQPRVAVDAQGHGVGVWEWYVPPFDRVTAGPRERAAVSRLPAGGAWTSPDELGAEQDLWHDLDLHPDGAAIVTYEQGCGRFFVPGCPDGKALEAARFRAGGGAVARERIRGDDRYPCVQIDNDAQVAVTREGAVAVWTEFGKDSVGGCGDSFHEMWSSRLRPGGGWSPAQRLARAEWLGGIDALDVAADDQGDGFVVYRTGPRYDDEAIWVRGFDPQGWQEPFQAAPRGRAPRLAMSRAGDALVWWLDGETGPTGGWVYTLRARWFSKRQRAWSEAHALPPEAQVMFDRSRAAVDEEGHALVAWSVLAGDEPGGIRASRFTAGRGFGPVESLRPPGPAAAFVSPPAVGSDARGNAVVAWSESDGVRVAIWTNRYVVR